MTKCLFEKCFLIKILRQEINVRKVRIGLQNRKKKHQTA